LQEVRQQLVDLEDGTSKSEWHTPAPSFYQELSEASNSFAASES
jgi:hypothetical protein